MRSRGWLLALCPLLFGFDLLQSPNHAVEAGNARMKAGKAEEALAEYDKAVKALPAEPGAHFNRGAALYSLSRFDEAANEFLRATEARTTALKAAAFYNLGNSYEQAGKHDDAMAAYRRALTLDPNDIRAKWNLELAQKRKKEEEQKKNQKPSDQNQDKDQQKNDDKKDDQAKNDDKKDEQKEQKKDEQKDQNKKDEQAQKDQKNDEKKNEQKDQAQKEQKKEEQKKEQAKNEAQPKPDKGPDMKEIEAVLDSLERSPKDLEKERARLRAVRRAPPSKDW